MKKLFIFSIFVIGALLLSPTKTEALGLKVAPLLYEEKLAEGEKKKGFIDISNPNDQATKIITEVQAFRQTNNNGDLEFYNQQEYLGGIQLDYTEFTLGPREALRFYFLLDANKLPKGGVYATILFSTVPGGANPDNTSIQPATRVGTHLVIENGGGGAKKTAVKEVKAPFFQFGKSIIASVGVSNIGGEKGLAFFPEVSAQAQPLGKPVTKTSSLVFPGITRTMPLEVPGNHFGLVRIKIMTHDSSAYAWAFVAIGHGRWLGPLVITLMVLAVIASIKLRNKR